MIGNGDNVQESDSLNSNAADIESASWGLPGIRSIPVESIEQQGQLAEPQLAGTKLSFDNIHAIRAYLPQWIRHSLMRMIRRETLSTSVAA